jgi:hypothetical protein
MIVVLKISAIVPGQMDAKPIIIIDNYINIIKFVKKSNEFKKIVNHLKLMVDKVPEKMQENWKTENGIEVGK